MITRTVLATLVFAAAALPEPAIAQQERPVASIAPSDRIAPQARVDAPRRAAAGAPKRDVFAPHSWQPPAAPVAKPKPLPEFVGPPVPPPPPPPPPLAMVFLGQLDVAGEPTVYYLALGERVLAVSSGDEIDGMYRVLAPEGRSLALMYVPLNVKQLLPMNRPPT